MDQNSFKIIINKYSRQPEHLVQDKGQVSGENGKTLKTRLKNSWPIIVYISREQV